MRKRNMIFGLFIVLAMMLSACGGLDGEDVGEGTSVFDETDTFMDGTTEPLNETPLVTVETEVVVETETPSVVETETAVVTETPMTNETVSVPETGMMDPGRLSHLLELEVRGVNDEEFGQMDDFILNIDNLQVDYAIIEVSDSMGTGARHVAVPFEHIELPGTTGQDMGTGVEEQNVIVLDITEEDLNNAPEFNQTTLPTLGETINEGWDSEYRNFWEGVTAGQDSVVETETPQANATATVVGTATEEVQATAEGMAGDQLQGVILASELMDMTLRGEADEEIADVEDAIIDAESGEIRYLLVNVTGLQGLEGQQMLIPLDDSIFSFDAQNNVLLVTVDQQVLMEAPTFAEDDLPDTTEEGWDTEFETYWETEVQR